MGDLKPGGFVVYKDDAIMIRQHGRVNKMDLIDEPKKAPTDKEMLLLAYGAITTSTDECLQLVKDVLHEHIFGVMTRVGEE